MTIDLAAIRTAVATQVADAVDELNTYTGTHSTTLPAFIVGRPALERHITFGSSGLSKVRLDCWVVAQAHDDEQSNADLDSWTVAVVDAIEADRTLGDVVTTVQVQPDGVQPGQMTIGSVSQPAIQITLDVWGTK